MSDKPKLSEILKVGQQVIIRSKSWSSDKDELIVSEVLNITAKRGDITLKNEVLGVFDCQGRVKSTEKYSTRTGQIEVITEKNKAELMACRRLKKLKKIWNIETLTDEQVASILDILEPKE